MLNTLPIDENTAVVVDGARELFRNGMGVLDEMGKPFEVLSVGMENIVGSDAGPAGVSLLIAGKFRSQKMYI